MKRQILQLRGTMFGFTASGAGNFEECAGACRDRRVNKKNQPKPGEMFRGMIGGVSEIGRNSPLLKRSARKSNN